MKKIWGKGKRQLTKALAGFMAALMVVTLVPVSSIPVKAAETAGSNFPATVLGEAVNYGVVAGSMMQIQHMQTNYAVKKFVMKPYSVNNDPDLLSKSEIVPFYAAQIDGGVRLDNFHPDTKTILYHVGKGHEEKIDIKYNSIIDSSMTASQIEDIISGMIENVRTKSTEFMGKPADFTLDNTVVSDSNNFKLDTTTGFDDNAIIYVKIPSGATNIMSVLANTGGLTVKKKSGQVIVFNFDTPQDKITLNQYNIQLGENRAKDSTGPQNLGEKNDFLTNEVMGKIVWNMPNASEIELWNTAGMFLALKKDVEVKLRNTTTGWLVADGDMTQVNGEWHFPYSINLDSVKPQTKVGVVKKYMEDGKESKIVPTNQAKFTLYNNLPLTEANVVTGADNKPAVADTSSGKNLATFVIDYPTNGDQTYYIKETTGVDGYTPSETVYKCVVNSLGGVTYTAGTVSGNDFTENPSSLSIDATTKLPVCENTKINTGTSTDTGSIKITKTISGANWDNVKENIEFSIKDSTKQIRAFVRGTDDGWTGDGNTKSFILSGLPVGDNYTVTETQNGLDGGKIGDIAYDVTVTGTGDTNISVTSGNTPEVKFENEYKALGTIELEKALTGRLPDYCGWESICGNIKFEITGPDGYSRIVNGSSFNNINGKYTIKINDLKAGTYHVQEIAKGEQWLNMIWGQTYNIVTTCDKDLNDDKAELTVTSGGTQKVKFTNTYNTTTQMDTDNCSITIRKTLGTGSDASMSLGDVMDKISFTISSSDTSVPYTTRTIHGNDLGWTEEDGYKVFQISNLYPATYKVEESNAIDGFTVSTTYQVDTGSVTTGAVNSIKVGKEEEPTDKIITFTNTYTKEGEEPSIPTPPEPEKGKIKIIKKLTGDDVPTWANVTKDDNLEFVIKADSSSSALITVKPSDSNFIKTSDTEYYVVIEDEKLTNGTSYVVEETGNGLDENNQINSEEYTVQTTYSKTGGIVTAGNDASITITNEYKKKAPDKGSITLTKALDFTGCTHVPNWESFKENVTFVLKDSSENTVKTITGSDLNSDNQYTFDDLDLNETYTLTETNNGVNAASALATPDYEATTTYTLGAATTDSAPEIAFSSSNKDAAITIKNTYTEKVVTPDPTGSIKIVKTVTGLTDDQWQAIADKVEFTVTDSSSQPVTGSPFKGSSLTKNAAGNYEITIESLPMGTYTVKETNFGFASGTNGKIGEDDYKVTVTPNDSLRTIELKNEEGKKDGTASFTNEYTKNVEDMGTLTIVKEKTGANAVDWTNFRDKVTFKITKKDGNNFNAVVGSTTKKNITELEITGDKLTLNNGKYSTSVQLSLGEYKIEEIQTGYLNASGKYVFTSDGGTQKTYNVNTTIKVNGVETGNSVATVSFAAKDATSEVVFDNNYKAVIEDFYVSKKDITGSDELSGATLAIYKGKFTGNTKPDSSETPFVGPWTSDASGAKLINGSRFEQDQEYTLVEEAAPSTHKFATNIIFKFTDDGNIELIGAESINLDKSTRTITMFDEAKNSFTLKLFKQYDGSVDDSVLSATEFSLYSDSNCSTQLGAAKSPVKVGNDYVVTFSQKHVDPNLACGQEYYIKETKTAPGYLASNKTFECKVDGDGNVTYSVVNGEDENHKIDNNKAICVNKEKTVEITFGGKKEVNGPNKANATDKTFAFELAQRTATGGSKVLETKEITGARTFTFDTPIKFGSADVGKTYTYVITEKNTDPIKGVIYDPAVWTIEVEVKDVEGSNNLIADITSGSLTNNVFTNVFAGDIKLIKTFSDSNITKEAAESAVFGLYTDENCTQDIIEKHPAKEADGKYVVTFEGSELKAECRTFYLKEISAPTGYDATTTVYVCTVEDDGSIQYRIKGESTKSPNFPTCLNVKSSTGDGSEKEETQKKGSVTLLGEKKLSGDKAPEETYQFILKEDSKEIATATSKGAGKFEFVIDYDAVGAHKYVISEKKGSTKGMTYSTETYQVTVEVKDNGGEKLEVNVTSEKGTGTYTFTNTYDKSKAGGSGNNKGSGNGGGSGSGNGGASGIYGGSGGSVTGSASGSAMDPILIRKVFIDGKVGAYNGERSGCYFTLFTDPSCKDEYAIADAKEVEAIWSQADGQWNLSIQSFIVPAGNIYYLKEVKAPSNYKVSDIVWDCIVATNGKVTYRNHATGEGLESVTCLNNTKSKKTGGSSDKAPKTGDPINALPFGAMAMLGLSAVFCFIMARRKRNESGQE